MCETPVIECIICSYTIFMICILAHILLSGGSCQSCEAIIIRVPKSRASCFSFSTTRPCLAMLAPSDRIS